MDKAIIFGVGNEWGKIQCIVEPEYEIVGFVDNAYNNFSASVLPPEEIYNLEYDIIIVTPVKNSEIINQLVKMGIAKDKIIIRNSFQDIHYNIGVNGIRYCSQYGEDLILTVIFNRLNIDKPSYIDLGACSPNIHSNTQLLYENGSRGINIEANPNGIMQFNVVRPDDINLNIGVADVDGELPYYILENQGLNTFSKELAEKQGEKIVDTVIVPVKTLSEIVDEYCTSGFPDFLDCDIEGYDYRVLKSYDFRSNGPKVIMCEVVGGCQHRLFNELMNKNGYSLFCRMVVNNIYVRNEYMDRLSMFN